MWRTGIPGSPNITPGDGHTIAADFGADPLKCSPFDVEAQAPVERLPALDAKMSVLRNLNLLGELTRAALDADRE